jgi:hypothetical protein
MPRTIPADEFDYNARTRLAEIGDELIKGGKMINAPGAIDDLVAHVTHFGVLDGRFVDLDSGLAAEVWVDKWLAARPHLQVPVFDNLAEQAFGDKPSWKARNDYIRKHGKDAYAVEAQRWGADPNSLAPGKIPEGGRRAEEIDEIQATLEHLKTLPDTELTKQLRAVAVEAAKEKKSKDLSDQRNNPWLHLRGRDGKIDPKATARCAEIVKSLGPKVAAGLAKAAGVDLAGRPLA